MTPAQMEPEARPETSALPTNARAGNTTTTLDPTNDPTGAAILWPLVMLAFYGLAAVGFFVVR